MKQSTYIGFLLMIVVTLAAGQQGASPITREGLLGALKTRALSGRELIGEVHTYGVSFELTTADEEQIRHTGKYLGKKGLDDLIEAIRIPAPKIILLLSGTGSLLKAHRDHRD